MESNRVLAIARAESTRRRYGLINVRTRDLISLALSTRLTREKFSQIRVLFALIQSALTVRRTEINIYNERKMNARNS